MTLQERRQTLISYLKMKVDQEDWHGASDAANDLREIDVELRLRQPTEVVPKIILNQVEALPGQ